MTTAFRRVADLPAEFPTVRVDAAAQLRRWIYGHGTDGQIVVLPGLVRRRGGAGRATGSSASRPHAAPPGAVPHERAL